jgi:hypothetical protein
MLIRTRQTLKSEIAELLGPFGFPHSYEVVAAGRRNPLLIFSMNPIPSLATGLVEPQSDSLQIPR